MCSSDLWVRHFRSPTDATVIYDIDWYTPRVRFAEGPGRDLPRATVDDSSLDPLALATVMDYAKSKDSYAFIVLANGRVEAEFYKDGFGPETLFDSQSMHKGLLGLAFDPQLLHGRNYVYVMYTYDADPGAGEERRAKIGRAHV